MHTTPVLFCLLVLSLCSRAAVAQCAPDPVDGPPGSGYGYEIALQGDTALVGAPYEEIGGVQSGAIHVLERTATGWVEVDVLVPPDPNVLQGFGFEFALDGDQLAVGSAFDDENGVWAGAVYVYSRASGSWALEQKLGSSTLGESDTLGTQIALDGERLVATAPGDDGGTGVRTLGAAFVYERGPGGWVETQKILNPTGVFSGNFGRAVDLEDGLLVITDYLDSGSGIWTYVDSGSGFVLDELLEYRAPEGSPITDVGWMGGTLALEDGLLAAGAINSVVLGQGQPGSAHVFERVGDDWEHRQEFINPSFLGPPVENGWFSADLDWDGGRLLVGGRQLADEGGAFLYVPEGERWTYAGRVEVPTAGTAFPFALEGDQALFGDGTSATADVVSFVSVPTWARGYCYCTDAPCGNSDGSGGCLNSVMRAARLEACGSNEVAADDLLLHARLLPPQQPALLAVAESSAWGGAPFANGLRCLAGVTGRLETTTSDADGQAIFGPGLGAVGAWEPGDARYFQVWYRDPDAVASGCGSSSNLTNGVSVRFAP